MGSIFSLFDTALAQGVPFSILQYIQRILHGVLLCVPFIFADSKRYQFGGTRDGFLCVTKIIHIFHSSYFDYKGACQKVLDSYCCVTG